MRFNCSLVYLCMLSICMGYVGTSSLSLSLSVQNPGELRVPIMTSSSVYSSNISMRSRSPRKYRPASAIIPRDRIVPAVCFPSLSVGNNSVLTSSGTPLSKPWWVTRVRCPPTPMTLRGLFRGTMDSIRLLSSVTCCSAPESMMAVSLDLHAGVVVVR